MNVVAALMASGKVRKITRKSISTTLTHSLGPCSTHPTISSRDQPSAPRHRTPSTARNSQQAQQQPAV